MKKKFFVISAVIAICLAILSTQQGVQAQREPIDDRPVNPRPTPPVTTPTNPPVPMVLSNQQPVLVENASVNRIAALMLSWQGQSPVRSTGYEGAATRLTIISRTLPSNLINSLSALTYGWKDCENSFLCLGGASYMPISIRIITGEQNAEIWRPFAVQKTLQLPLGLSLHRAETYLLKNPPKGTLWMLEHPKGDYLITGALVENLGSTTKVIRGKNLASAIQTQMNLSQLLTQKGVTRWLP
jgi:hypothetical protein